MASARRGIVWVSARALLEALRVPPGTDLLAVEFDRYRDTIALFVGSDTALPLVPEGQMIPAVTITCAPDGTSEYSR